MSTFRTDPWVPFEPTEADPWDLRKVAHLHRRAGFGATWEELHRDLDAGPEASVDRLLNPPEPPAGERAILDGLVAGAAQSNDLQRLKAAWLYRMRFGPDPLREKLTLFWHGHFATSFEKVDSVRGMADQVETLRANALGPFEAMLSAVVADPAMLVWLDGGKSRKERPNENFAREFLELFTLGPGPYTEADIREASRAFTGWAEAGGLRMSMGEMARFRFDPSRHDDGPKTFLGQEGAWGADDIIRITLERPEASRFLARKLDRAFLSESEEPPPDRLEALAETLRSSGFDIGHVVGMILRSRAFFDADSHQRRVKSPVEFTLGLARMLEVPRPDLNLLALAAACDRQGQALFAPPSVKGWDGGPNWITGATILERLNAATDLLFGNPEYGVPPYDPIAWAEARGIPPAEAAGAFVDLLLQGDLDPEADSLIRDAGRDGTAEGLRTALQRLIHCPEFQLS